MATAKTGTLAGFGLAAVALGAALSLTITNLTVKEPINFTPTGTSSGVVIQVNGITEVQAFTVSCTATGGNVKVSGGAKYDTCIMPALLSTTGAIKEISFAGIGSESVVGLDCGFVKGRNSGTGTSFTNLSNVVTGTGVIARFATGSIRWNPADFIKCGTLGTLGPAGTAGKGFSGKLRVELYDDQSE